MQLYAITLPLYDNSGQFADTAHHAFERYLLQAFGGYSVSQAAGAWRDDDGKVYEDRTRVFQVATDNPDAAALMVGQAQRLFPDQLAFFWAHLGSAGIHTVSK